MIGVIKNPNGTIVLRPSLSVEKCNERIITMLKMCWDENPERRPSFVSIKRSLRGASPEGWVYESWTPMLSMVRITQSTGI